MKKHSQITKFTENKSLISYYYFLLNNKKRQALARLLCGKRDLNPHDLKRSQDP